MVPRGAVRHHSDSISGKDCAADLDALHPKTGVRVLTNDFGMQLHARQMGLTALKLPDDRFREDNQAT